MKSSYAAESGDKPINGSTRRHINSRLHKAIIYAQHLVEVLEDSRSGAQYDDILEARAYLTALMGAVELEKRKWEQCLHTYSESRLIYATMAKSGNAKRDETVRDLLSGNIDPSIRYAAYQLKLPRTMPIDTIVARYLPRTADKYIEQILRSNPNVLNEAGEGQGKGISQAAKNVPKTIRWRAREVNLEDMATAQALAAVSDAGATLSSFLSSNAEVDVKSKASTYDEILIRSQDAVDATKTAIDELASEGVTQGDQRMQDLQITRTAVNYALIGWRIGRNRVLCGDQDGAFFSSGTVKRSGRKPDGKPGRVQEESRGRRLTRLRERVVLYDAILQSLDSVKELPGVVADQPFMQELDAKRAYFAALRCLSVAHSYRLLAQPKKALALFARALDVCSTISPSATLTGEAKPGTPPNMEVTSEQVKSLHNLLQGLVSQHRALVELHSMSAAAANEDEKRSQYALPLIDRLDEYPASGADLGNLVTYPPKIQPIPVKPLFLDIAWYYLEYPGRTGLAKEGINGKLDGPAAQPQRKKGWFGFGR